MQQFPPLRINLFPERDDKDRDFWGFINIRKEDIPTWQAFLANDDNCHPDNAGNREISVKVIGWKKDTPGHEGEVHLAERRSAPKRREPEALRRWSH